MAREAPEDPYAGLADSQRLAMLRSADGLDLFDPTADPDPAMLQEDARRARGRRPSN